MSIDSNVKCELNYVCTSSSGGDAGGGRAVGHLAA